MWKEMRPHMQAYPRKHVQSCKARPLGSVPVFSSKQWRQVFVCLADALAYFQWRNTWHKLLPHNPPLSTWMDSLSALFLPMLLSDCFFSVSHEKVNSVLKLDCLPAWRIYSQRCCSLRQQLDLFVVYVCVCVEKETNSINNHAVLQQPVLLY